MCQIHQTLVKVKESAEPPTPADTEPSWVGGFWHGHPMTRKYLMATLDGTMTSGCSVWDHRLRSLKETLTACQNAEWLGLHMLQHSH